MAASNRGRSHCMFAATAFSPWFKCNAASMQSCPACRVFSAWLFQAASTFVNSGMSCQMSVKSPFLCAPSNALAKLINCLWVTLLARLTCSLEVQILSCRPASPRLLGVGPTKFVAANTQPIVNIRTGMAVRTQVGVVCFFITSSTAFRRTLEARGLTQK